MSYTHLTSNERYVIAHLIAFKLSMREIARRIGRASSSIHVNSTAMARDTDWYIGMKRVKDVPMHANTRRDISSVDIIQVAII